MNRLTIALYLAGAAHFGILIASALVPFKLEWKKSLAGLPDLLRQLFWVYGGYVVLSIIGLGTLTLINAEELATGTKLARSFCAFVAIFWGVRLSLQFFVFDPTPFLTNWFYKLGYHGLTVVFIFLVAVYGWAAFAR